MGDRDTSKTILVTGGTAVQMDACRKYGIERYHQVSTDEVQGWYCADHRLVPV